MVFILRGPRHFLPPGERDPGCIEARAHKEVAFAPEASSASPSGNKHFLITYTISVCPQVSGNSPKLTEFPSPQGKGCLEQKLEVLRNKLKLVPCVLVSGPSWWRAGGGWL